MIDRTNPVPVQTGSPVFAFTLNGEPVAVTAPPSRRLLDVLRHDLLLTGTKIGCAWQANNSALRSVTRMRKP